MDLEDENVGVACFSVNNERFMSGGVRVESFRLQCILLNYLLPPTNPCLALFVRIGLLGFPGKAW